jgi:hypothetical protein
MTKTGTKEYGMELAGRQQRYIQLRREAPTTVIRLELGMIAAVLLTYAMGGSVWVRDPWGDWPNPNDRDDP